MEIFKLFGSILINDAEAMKSLSSVEKKFESVGGKLEKFGKGLMTKVTAPLVGLGAGVLKIGSDFESAMSQVEAMSGATGEQMERLEKAARDAGAATSKSAKDAADGLTFMALAGWDVETSIAGLMPVLRLSEAGSIDLARASSLVTDSMSAMGIEVQDLEGYLDIVAQTARSSNTDIDQMAEAYLGVGGTLRGLNIPLEESALALGMMANAGIKGSEAGTKLNKIMLNLTAPTGQAKKALEELGLTAFDSEGNFKGLENVLFEVKGKTENLTTEQKNMYLSMIAGSQHIDGMNALMNGLDDSYLELKESIGQADGALNDIATTMQDNVKGKINILKSSLEEVFLQLYDHLLPQFEKMIEWLQKGVDWFSNLEPAIQENIVKIALLVGAIGPIIFLGGKVISGIGAIIGLGKTLISVIGFMTSPIGLVVIAITGLIAIGVALYKNWDTVKEKATELGNKISDTWDNVKTKTVEAWDDVKAKVSGTIKGLATDSIQWGKDIVTGLWNGITGAKDWIVGKVSGFAKDVAGGFKKVFGIASPSKLMAEYGGNIVDGLVNGIDSNKHKGLGSMTKMAKEITSEFDKLGNAVITALKKRYQEEERLQLNSLQKQVDNLKKKTDEKMAQYDRELQAKLDILDLELSEEEKALQAKIDAINNLTAQEEKELKEQEYQNKVAVKEKEFLDADSAEERLKIQQDLNKLRADKERELLLEQRSMQISALQEEMNNIRQQAQEKRNELQLEYEEKKKNEENKLNLVITNLNSEMEATKTHYATLLEEENLQAEARRLILDENNQELIDLLESYNPAWHDAGRSFGENLLEGLNSMKQSIQDAVSEILGMVETADIANARIIQAKVDWQEAYSRGDKDGMDAAHQRAEEARKQGGTIGADEPLKGSFTQINNIYSPTPLNPSEVARQTKNASREFALGLP